MKKIEVKIVGYNNFQVMYKSFENIKCKINDIEYSISYSTLVMKVIIQTENEFIDVEKEFWKLYDYIGFILGYYPIIDSALIVSEKNNRVLNLANIVEKYKISNDFILEETQFIDKIDNEEFEFTYVNFKKLKEIIELQISVYNISIMKNNNYPEIRITNILQALDGLYDNLSFTKNRRTIVKDINKIKKIKNYINEIDLNIFNLDDKERKNIKKNISNSICRLEFVNYDTKLRNLFDYLNDKFNLFELEKKQISIEKNYDKLISKCKHTRNKLSHVTNIRNSFNGKESALYVFKIILAFRLLIIDEIGLSENIDNKMLNKYINLINKRIVEELKLEEI